MNRLLCLAALVLAACSSTGVVPADAGTYLIAKREAQFGIGPPVGIKGEAYREANDFCARTGKAVETVQLDEVGSHVGRMASVSLRFKCISPT